VSVGPGAGPPTSGASRREPRPGLAAGLFAVALAIGGLAVGLFATDGLVALSSQKGVAQVLSCRSGRHESCFAQVRTPAGEILDHAAEIPNSTVSEGDEVRVRYRAGKAVRDDFSGRVLPFFLIAACAVGSVVALVAAVGAALGLIRRPVPRSRRQEAEPTDTGRGSGPG
jgi:hypothetical protein